MNRPRRPPKFDRFTAPDASAGDTAAHYALAPFDEAIRQADLAWGVDRLPGLVSPETAAKWGGAMVKLNAAIASGNVDEVTARVGVCLRGIAAMHAEAEAAGKPKSDPRVMELSDGDQFRFGIIEDDRDWPALKAARPDLMFFTRREVVNAMKAYHNNLPAIEAVKAVFPDAKLSKIKTAELVDDSIPFGG